MGVDQHGADVRQDGGFITVRGISAMRRDEANRRIGARDQPSDICTFCSQTGHQFGDPARATLAATLRQSDSGLKATLRQHTSAVSQHVTREFDLAYS